MHIFFVLLWATVYFPHKVFRVTFACGPIYLHLCSVGQRNYKMAAVLTSSLPKLTNLWTNPLRCLHLSTILSQIRILKRPICIASDYNPFFNQETLPRFSELRTVHVVPAIEKLTQDFENDFTEFEAKLAGQWRLRLSYHLIIQFLSRSPSYTISNLACIGRTKVPKYYYMYMCNILSRGWVSTVEAPGYPRHPPCT